MIQAKCKNCNKRNWLAEDTELCWSCNDTDIIEKYHPVALNPSKVAREELDELTNKYSRSH